MLLGMATSKHRVEGLREARQVVLRLLRGNQALHHSDKTLDLDMGPQAPDGVRRQVVFELGLLVGMKEETMITQQAQDHATAGAFYARLLGQLVPTCMPLPGLHKYLYEPSQGMALHNVE